MQIIRLNVSDDNFIFYKSNQQKNFESFSQEIQDIGYIQFVIDKEDCVHLVYMFIHPEHRGKGLGENLLKLMFTYCIDKMKERNTWMFDIFLDDMSDRYGQSRNIYLKTGFIYDEIESGIPCGPEMTKTIKI
jgi:GNAT superfamily N-acetyltransferase